MPAVAGPPRFSSKNARCSSVGAPSVIDQATIRPRWGTTNASSSSPTRTWKPVVRDTAWHGLAGQLGALSVAVSPISMIAASAGAAKARPPATSAAVAACRSKRVMPAFNTTTRSGLLPGRRGASRPPPRAQTLCTLTALGPLSPFSSS